MSAIIEISIFYFLGILICYALLILFFNVSWFSIKTYATSEKPLKTKVSVVLPVRNESENILQCLEKISSQNYPTELFEIIVVDDSSTDNTVDLVREFISRKFSIKITLLELSKLNLSSKKLAITQAVNVSTGEIIITTDADCTMVPDWIKSLVEYYEEYKPAMIIAPVCFNDEKNVFQKMQSLEFLSLISSGAASVKLGIPAMCNGANLVYEKKAFLKVGGFDKNNKYASGDDVFLMHKIKSSLNGKIAFIKNYNSVVQTKPQPNLNYFFNQRKRWVSKSRGYTDFPTILIALIVYLNNLSIILCLAFSIFYPMFLKYLLLIFALKFIIDFPILLGISTFTKKKKLMYFYIPLQIAYPVYVVVIGIMGLFGNYQWKDRINGAYEKRK